MASITSWTRLEPLVRQQDPAEALRARVHDPLWLLARQWQVGEFTGEDAGSPLRVRVELQRSPITRYAAGTPVDGGPGGEPYGAGSEPLEVRVEAEGPAPDSRLSVEAGLMFLRLLRRRGVGRHGPTFVAHYPLGVSGSAVPPHPDTVRLLRTAAARVPDGLALAGDVRAGGGVLPDLPVVEADDRDDVAAAARALVSWLDSRAATGAPAGPDAGRAPSWQPERMEYAFAVGGPAPDGETVLAAAEYASGHLDWQAFDHVPGGSIGASGDGGADGDVDEVLVREAVPAPVSYPGMPVSRWWEFEDGQVNFGAADAEPSDLLRLLLVTFALEYGNDWFVVPAEVPADGLYRVTSVVVTDGFGVRTRVVPYWQARAAGSRWRMFSLSVPDGTEPTEGMLFVPPALGPSLHGEPVEEVLLLRDEVANLAWAVEHRVADEAGRPVDRHERYLRDRDDRNADRPASGSADRLRYRVASTVPEHWLPLVPERDDPQAAGVRLVRGRVLHDGEDGPRAPEPLGRLLEPGRPLRLFDEEVGQFGSRVTRAYQYARWTDGSRHLWLARTKAPGRGPGSSGLSFDMLESDRR